MSDIFSQIGNIFETQRDQQAQERFDQFAGTGNNFAIERNEQQAERFANIRQRNERARQLREQYGYDYSIDQYAALGSAIDSGIIGEDQAYDILAAQTIADNFERQGIRIDPLEIYQNLPAYREYVLGGSEGQPARTPKTNLAAIHGAFVTAGANMRKNFLGMQLADARGGSNAELEKIIQERLRQEDEIIGEYGDYQKRNFFVEAAKLAAQSSVYTAFVTAGGLLGGAPGAVAAGWAGATGQAYLGLDAAGVDHKIAHPIAVAVGAVNAAIEVTLGNVAGLIGRATGAKTLQSAFAKRAAAFVSDKLHLSGAALKMATGPVANYVLENMGEVSEEVFQEIADIVGTELAAFLQKEGVRLDRGDYISRVAQAAKGGFMASLFMGLPGLSIDTVGHISDYKALRTDADTIPSQRMFKERHKDSPLRGDMTDEEWDKELSKIHEGRQGIREREEARAAEELKAAAGLGEGYAEEKRDEDGNAIPLGETYRRNNGLLHTELDEKRGLFKIGDPRVEGARNLYSHIGYALGGDGAVRIKEFKVRPDLDTPEFRREIWGRFTEAFAGHEPVWEAANTREAEIIDDLAKNNPYGNGLNYYPEALSENVADDVMDTAAKGDTAEAARMKLRFGEQMAAHLPGSTEASRSGAVRLVDRIGRAYGYTFDQFIEKLRLDPENIFTHEAGMAVKAENAMAAQLAQEGESPQKVRGALQPWVKLDSDMKAVQHSIVYLDPERADYSTVIHELKHAVDNFLEKNDAGLFKRMMDAAGEYDPYNSGGTDESTWRRERSAYAFETYLQTGQAPTAELRGLFRQMKEWLKDIIDYLSGMRRLTPEQKEVFDELLSKADKAAADWDASEAARVAREGQARAAAANDTAAATESAREAAAAPGEADAEPAGERPGDGAQEKNSAENEQRVAKARERWDEAHKIYGSEDQITLPNGEIWDARHVLGEADIASGSVDAEQNFAQSGRFPVNEDGTSQNVGRDYTEGFAREAIDAIAADFDQRGDGIVVDTNGVVLSGNNRKTSREVAARNGTDGKYVNYLKLRPERWGFTQADIAAFRHPTHYLEVRAPAVYTPHVFDIFNRSGEKSTSPLETAVKMSYLIDRDAVNEFSLAMGNYDSVSELYEDTRAATDIFKSLMKRGIVTENAYPEYVETVTIRGVRYERVTSGGKEFLESVMLGAALNTDSIRSLALVPEVRKRVVKGLAALVDNAALGEYSVIAEINQAIAIAVEVQANKKKYKGIEDYADQAEMDLGQRVSTDIEVELAGRLLEKTEYGFADMMGGLNAVLQEEARGQSDMFGGTSKDDILRRYLGVKARADGIRAANTKTIESDDAPTAEKVEAALDNAGLARAEADGTLFQAAFHGSPHRFERFDSSHMGEGEGSQIKGWGHYCASKKEVAEWYRDKLSLGVGAEVYVDGVKADVIGNYPGDREVVNLYRAVIDGELDNYIQILEEMLAEAIEEDRLVEAGSWQRMLAKADALRGKKVEVKSGQLYEVDIPGDDVMLDWDKPFDEQPEKVKKALETFIHDPILRKYLGIMNGKINHNPGSDIYRGIADKLNDNDGLPVSEKYKAASQYLNSLGIKGIRYLDGDSRAAGEGTYNYVIFDDSDISITRTFFQLADELAAEGAGTLFQTGYHGSPFKFDRFDFAHMGRGAGAQLRGHGGYIASVRGVAERYVPKNNGPKTEYYVDGKKANVAGPYLSIYSSAAEGRLDESIRFWEEARQKGGRTQAELAEARLREARKLQGKKVEKRRVDEEGHLYEVEIPERGEMLDWDRPMSAQPEYVKKILRQNKIKHGENTTGENLYDQIVKAKGSPAAASKYLNSVGISGIRYLDNLSRTANYVIFDANDISITQTFFQLDGDLVAEAAQYDSWHDFRDAYQQTLFQAAYHGSPHRFERFDSSHMSEGEGNQTFGWGHYFAGKKEVAEYYRETLSSRKGHFEEMDDKKFSGRTMMEWYRHWEKGIYDKNPAEIRPRFDRMAMIENLMINYDYKNTLKEARENEYTPEAIAWFEKTFEKEFQTPGQLYEVDIPGDDEMLDWDKPLNEQPEKIKKIKDQLITWEYDNESKTWKLPFAHAKITIYQFEDGYGLKGDMNKRRYNSLEEAKEEIINYFYSNAGAGIYNILTQRLGSKKAASEYLNSLGIKGIRYLDGESRGAGEGTYNYVVFDDSDINITQTFFQLDADSAWYRSLWNDAQKIHNKTLFQEEEKPSRAGELDKRFYRDADKKYLTEALLELYRVHNDQSLEPAEEEGDAAHEEYRRIKRLQHRIQTELPNAGSVIGMAAQARNGSELNDRQFTRLKGFMRKNTRDFRAVFADVMGQEEYLEDLAETKGGEPAGRLADPRPDRQDTKARLKEIADAVRESDPALAKEIEGGTARYDDPRIAAFEAGAESEYAEAKAALDALEKETAEDYARLANDAGRRIVAAYERTLEARGRMNETNERLRRMADEEGKIAEPYLKRQRLEKASYDQAYKAYNDLINLHGLDADVREAVARREAKAAERERQKAISKKRRAAKALREMKLAHLKRITRRVKFENVAYEQAVVIKAIQRIFLPSIVETGDRFVGTIDGPLLRQVWGCWQTDEEYREKMRRDAKTDARAEKLESLLEKPWDFLTRKDKQEIIRLMPKPTVTSFLNLRELAAEYKEDAQIDIEEKVVNGEALLIVGAELEAKVKEAIGEEAYRRVRHKALEEWTPGELEELARAVDRLTVEGRRELAAKREARRSIERRYRSLVLDMIQTGGIDIKDDDTPEEKERKRKELARIAKQGARYQGRGRRNNLLNNFFDANLRRWTTAMDGGRKGVFTDLFYWMENDAYNKEQTRIAARRLLVETVMKEKGIRLDELYRKMEIPLYEASALFEQSGRKMEPAAREMGLPESTWDMDAYFKDRPKPDLTGTSFHDGITVDDLLYVMRGIKNEHTRKAIIYGNLSTAAERAHYESRSNDPLEIAAFENIGYYRLLRVLALADDFFAKPENKKFLAMAEAIGEDFDRNGEILNRACIEMFDRPMWRVDNYVPMSRMEQSGEENQNLVIADMLGVSGAGFHWTPSGFKEKRIDMSPYHQAPVKTGLYKTWAQSVTDTEHFMAYGPAVQRLNAVFKGHNAAVLREALYNRWGGASAQRVDDTIAEFANPNARGNPSGFDNFVRGLRGKTATAYLAWKMSGILKQFVTSPWPYLQEIPPHEYIAACIEVAGGAGKINDMIREKSIFMKNRDFDPMMKMVREAMEKNDSAVLGKLDQFNRAGMRGLQWVDWIWVAPGWLATYKRELANVAKEQEAEYQKLLKKYQGSEYSDVLPTTESKTNKALSEVLSDEQQDAEAVARADDAVRRMQPSSRSTDVAPLFKERSEMTKALLQFQMALNVIWQNIRYDLPLAIKEKQVGTIVGMVAGYMAAGVCLGMLQEIGNDDDDDDEEGKLARRILFYSFTQFTDAVPVIGDGVTRLAEQAVTGKTRYSGQQSLLPVLEKGFGGVGKIIAAAQSEDPEKGRKIFIRAVKGMGEAAGIYFGLPVSGMKEFGAAAGIGDGDGEPDLYWQALLGQRKK